MATNHWDIDVGHSAIHFWVRHMVISKVHGRFARWSGSIALDPQDLTRSAVDVRIELGSALFGQGQCVDKSILEMLERHQHRLLHRHEWIDGGEVRFDE